MHEGNTDEKGLCMITEGDNTPYLVVVDTGGQNTVQDSLLNL